VLPRCGAMSMRGRRLVLSGLLIAGGLVFFAIGGGVQAWCGAGLLALAVWVGCYD